MVSLKAHFRLFSALDKVYLLCRFRISWKMDDPPLICFLLPIALSRLNPGTTFGLASSSSSSSSPTLPLHLCSLFKGAGGGNNIFQPDTLLQLVSPGCSVQEPTHTVLFRSEALRTSACGRAWNRPFAFIRNAPWSYLPVLYIWSCIKLWQQTICVSTRHHIQPDFLSVCLSSEKSSHSLDSLWPTIKKSAYRKA